MKTEEINRAIAEIRGYSKEEIRLGYTLSQMSEPIPNYYASLDACAEFEEPLAGDALVAYCRILWEITCGKSEPLCFDNLCCVVCATPASKCEAFLRMHGLWRDGE